MKDYLINKIGFGKLLGAVALSLAFVAAFFSIFGIATLFSGAFISTTIMAGSIEAGKIVSVVFLYRHWRETPKFLKIYLSIACMVVMLITSLGIFGYLSSAYQQSALKYKTSQENITMVESQKVFYTNQIAQSEFRIKSLTDARLIQEARLSEAITNSLLSRNPLQLKQLQEQTISLINQANDDIKSEYGHIRTNQAKIMLVNEDINKLKLTSSNQKDIKTFQFVADQFGTSLDTVAKWFIFTIIFVFDPLAISLILAYNIVAYKNPAKKELNSIDKKINSDVSSDNQSKNPALTPEPTTFPLSSSIDDVITSIDSEPAHNPNEKPAANPSDSFFKLYFKK